MAHSHRYHCEWETKVFSRGVPKCHSNEQVWHGTFLKGVIVCEINRFFIRTWSLGLSPEQAMYVLATVFIFSMEEKRRSSNNSSKSTRRKKYKRNKRDYISSFHWRKFSMKIMDSCFPFLYLPTISLSRRMHSIPELRISE